jgi:acyl-coenzyme A thioesterase 13
MENVKIIDATPQGTVDFEFHIDERYTNLNGVMHGGAAGVIFDMCTTSALGPLAKPGYWEYVLYPKPSDMYDMKLTKTSFLGGVTRTLNISYLRAIPMGSSLLSLFHPIENLRLLRRNHDPHP